MSMEKEAGKHSKEASATSYNKESIRSFLKDIRNIHFDKSTTSISQEPEYIESLPTISELYKNVEFWHGTGRYKYSQDGSIVDILQGIIQEGGLVPHEDEWDSKMGVVQTVSTGRSRMYARLYAGMYVPNAGRISNELGSRELWGLYFFVTSAIAALRERMREDRFSVADVIRKVRRDDNWTAFDDKTSAWSSKISKEKHSFRDVFLQGTDIAENYPVLIGIKKGAFEPKAGSAMINRHESRTSSPVLFDAISHIEVPKAKVQETSQVFARAGHNDIAVFPIEYGEEYCRNFSFHTLKSGRPLDQSQEHIVPSSENRNSQREENADTIRLADARPLWYALLEDPDVLVLKPNDANEARGTLRELFNVDPDTVRGCEGIPINAAREKLQSILLSDN